MLASSGGSSATASHVGRRKGDLWVISNNAQLAGAAGPGSTNYTVVAQSSWHGPNADGRQASSFMWEQACASASCTTAAAMCSCKQAHQCVTPPAAMLRLVCKSRMTGCVMVQQDGGAAAGASTARPHTQPASLCAAWPQCCHRAGRHCIAAGMPWP